ncbi:hypothetical protein CK203_069997 [Vitis vinifera]|uniref:Uncharacterized protein n=1 Tax=Vitis vinifera TaxID=29760 RepID=A0A438EPL2_VITVI|nr:hypothetical protein CK203_069997 [Vitis vinifera]
MLSFIPNLNYMEGAVVCGRKRFLRDKGLWYYEAAKKSGWGGVVEEKEYISSIS